MSGHPEIRQLWNGDTVVDYGLIWFRVRSNGEIIKKTAVPSGVKTQPANVAETKKVRKVLATWVPA